ncbi:MAG: M48 family metalloprotease [Acidobacteriia bacterium]|nr:M48 family metalloprotease [Terriglobia bacterium]
MTYGTVRRQLIGLCLAAVFACAAAGQEQSAETAAPAKMEIRLDAYGAAAVNLRIPGASLHSPLTPLISQVLGCNFENPKDRDVAGDWVFSGRCAGAFRKRGLLVGGQFQFAPLVEALKEAQVERLDVIIRHPRTGSSRLAENGWALETTAQSLEYTKTLATSAPVSQIHLAFGYRPINFLPLTLLLFPVGLTMVTRWAALRARNTDPVVVWFTYWRLFGWVITGSWLLWVQGSTVFDCAALARFLLNDSSAAPLLQVAFYLVPPVLVQLICTLTSGAVLARVSGERWMLPVSLKHAFWHEPVNIWPLLSLLAGVACLTLFNELLLGLICLAVAYVGHMLLVRLWLRFQNLGRYTLPTGELRSHIVELAQKAGIRLNEIYLLPAAEGRLDAPYMVRRRRLFLSDALLKMPHTKETEAVLAREFVHLRGRHREVLIGAAILALPLIYRFSHLAAVEGALPWAIRGPLLVWLAPVTLYLLWRRFERTTDAEAAKISGNPAAVLDAPMKIAEFNVFSLYCRRLERRFFPNGNASEPKDKPETLPARGTQTGALIP